MFDIIYKIKKIKLIKLLIYKLINIFLVKYFGINYNHVKMMIKLMEKILTNIFLIKANIYYKI